MDFDIRRALLAAILGALMLALTFAIPAAAESGNQDEGSAAMQTFQEQLDFFNEQWPKMAAAAEANGCDGIVEYIGGFDDDLERRVLYMFARQGLGNSEWPGKSLDLLIEVADAGMAEFIRQAEAAPDKETRNKRVDGANVISFNLAADLADCWPGDDTPREQRHFERGLKAAEDCLRWREMLGKPAGPFSMAYWVHGMHALSLGDTETAISSFQSSLEYAQQVAAEEGATTEISAESTFGVILEAGYLGLARWKAGVDGGQELYEEAIAAFTAQLQDTEKQDDARFGIDQLQTVKSKYIN
jgi:hypothetical protein